MLEKINSANLGFEKEIFAAADKLRGNMDAVEYKNVVLGLIFLKYISDSFEEKYNSLLEEEMALKKILTNILQRTYSLFQKKLDGILLLQKL